MCQTLPLILPEWTGYIPLCDATSQKLEQILWLAGDVDRSSELLSLLQIDPALSLFLAAELLPQANQSERSLAGLSKLASPALSCLLSQYLNVETEKPDHKATVPLPTRLENTQLPSLAAHAVTTSKVVFRLATAHQCAEPAAFELAAHLFSAAELVFADQSAENQQPNNEKLSDWFVHLCNLPNVIPFCSIADTLLSDKKLAEKQTVESDEFPSGNQPESVPSATAELLAECPALANSVTTHWQTELPEAFPALHKLVKRLAPLEALQLEFDARLETEKLLAMKELAYGAGHEINNPLANISVRAQTLIKQETDPERKRMLAAINGQVYRAHEMIADLMLFAQPPQMTLTSTNLNELVQNLTKELQPEAERQNTTLVANSASRALIANVDPLQLSLAIHAMVMNSLEAIGRGGRIELFVQQTNLPKGRTQATIVVQDDGPGISDEVRQHLFDPFYSGREAGRGLGFGLSKCWRIVTAHGGHIKVDHSLVRGAKFFIVLPILASSTQPVGQAKELAINS